MSTATETTMHNIQLNDHGDAFDWTWAIWYWLSHWHGGQSCPKYSVMSTMTGRWNITNIPSIDFDDGTEDYDNDEYTQTIVNYHQINEENWEDIFAQFEHYMENKWDDDE